MQPLLRKEMRERMVEHVFLLILNLILNTQHQT